MARVPKYQNVTGLADIPGTAMPDVRIQDNATTGFRMV